MFYTVSQVITNGYGFQWITLLSLLAIALAIFTISSKNPINSVLFLIGLFIAISLYLIIFDMTFIALSYLLVYVGAVSILFLFIVMLINIRISELLTEGKNSVILAILVIVSFGLIFNNKLPYFIDMYEDLLNYVNRFSGEGIHSVGAGIPSELSTNMNYTGLPAFKVTGVGEVISKSWDNSLTEITHISAIGNILYNVLFINLLIIGIILLVAMVGAIVITVKAKDNLDQERSNKVISNTDYINKSPL